jgi:hypothetical protein
MLQYPGMSEPSLQNFTSSGQPCLEPVARIHPALLAQIGLAVTAVIAVFVGQIFRGRGPEIERPGTAGAAGIFPSWASLDKPLGWPVCWFRLRQNSIALDQLS